MLEKLKAKAQEAAATLGLDIISVKIKNDGNDKILEIIADKEDRNVDVDELGELNKIISDYCDEIGYTDIDYVEVSSQGIGDELLSDEDRAKAQGQDVDIVLAHSVKGISVTEFHGILESYSPLEVVIKANIKGAIRHVTLAPADISLIREHIEIDDIE